MNIIYSSIPYTSQWGWSLEAWKKAKQTQWDIFHEEDQSTSVFSLIVQVRILSLSTDSPSEDRNPSTLCCYWDTNKFNVMSLSCIILHISISFAWLICTYSCLSVEVSKPPKWSEIFNRSHGDIDTAQKTRAARPKPWSWLFQPLVISLSH